MLEGVRRGGRPRADGRRRRLPARPRLQFLLNRLPRGGRGTLDLGSTRASARFEPGALVRRTRAASTAWSTRGAARSGALDGRCSRPSGPSATSARSSAMRCRASSWPRSRRSCSRVPGDVGRRPAPSNAGGSRRSADGPLLPAVLRRGLPRARRLTTSSRWLEYPLPRCSRSGTRRCRPRGMGAVPRAARGAAPRAACAPGRPRGGRRAPTRATLARDRRARGGVGRSWWRRRRRRRHGCSAALDLSPSPPRGVTCLHFAAEPSDPGASPCSC